MGRAGAAWRLTATACLAAAALAPGLPRADPAPEPAREGAGWRLSAVTLGFTDSFLGVPRTALNDDNGFVANLRAGAELSDRQRRAVRLGAALQMITERGGLRRVDDGKVWAEWQPTPAGARGFDVAWLLGVDVIGDLGGSRLQNWAHQTVFSGRVLGGTGARRLQDRYPRRTEVLGMVGARARGLHPLRGPLSLRGGVDVALGAGTGFFSEVHPYVALGATLGFLDLELRQGAGTYWTTIGALTMPGGYETHLLENQPSARLTLTGPRWLPLILGVELQWNSGNTSQHVGGIVLGARL